MLYKTYWEFQCSPEIFGGTSKMTEGMKSISGGVSILPGIYTITYGFQWGDQHLGRPQMLDISIRLP